MMSSGALTRIAAPRCLTAAAIAPSAREANSKTVRAGSRRTKPRSRRCHDGRSDGTRSCRPTPPRPKTKRRPLHRLPLEHQDSDDRKEDGSPLFGGICSMPR